MNSTVKDVMSTHIYAVREGASFKEIATRLHELRVSAFPVIDLDGTVIGVVSEAKPVSGHCPHYRGSGRLGIAVRSRQGPHRGRTTRPAVRGPYR